MRLSNKGRIWLLICVVIVVAIIWGAWGGSSNKKLSIDTGIQSKCNSQIHDETFCKFAGAFANAGAYKVSMTNQSKTGTMSVELASDTSGNGSMLVSSNGKVTADVIKFNNATYVKDPSDNKWIKYSAGNTSAPQLTDLKQEFVKGNFDKNDKGQAISYKSAGTEACGSLQCYKYQIIESNQTGYLWFDNSSYLLRRISINASGSTSNMTVDYANVNISEPSPVKQTL